MVRDVSRGAGTLRARVRRALVYHHFMDFPEFPKVLVLLQDLGKNNEVECQGR